MNLKAYFHLKGLQQKQVAHLMGMSKPAMSRYVNGVRELPLRKMIKFCEIIGIDLAEFIRGNIVEIGEEGEIHEQVSERGTDIIFQ